MDAVMASTLRFVLAVELVVCTKVLRFHQMQSDFFLWSLSQSKLDGVVENNVSYSLLGISLTSCDVFLHTSL
jgi:hypothetical protein